MRCTLGSEHARLRHRRRVLLPDEPSRRGDRHLSPARRRRQFIARVKRDDPQLASHLRVVSESSRPGGEPRLRASHPKEPSSVPCASAHDRQEKIPRGTRSIVGPCADEGCRFQGKCSKHSRGCRRSRHVLLAVGLILGISTARRNIPHVPTRSAGRSRCA